MIILCTKCGAEKPDVDFYDDKKKKNGKQSCCKACSRTLAVAWCKNNPEKHRAISRRVYHRRKNSAKFKAKINRPGARLSSYRSDAKRREHEFTLTKEEFMLFWQKPCHYCNDPIETAGLDRVDNNKGYVLGNLVPCCWTCNMAKRAMTKADFLRHCIKIADKWRDKILVDGAPRAETSRDYAPRDTKPQLGENYENS